MVPLWMFISKQHTTGTKMPTIETAGDIPDRAEPRYSSAVMGKGGASRVQLGFYYAPFETHL